MQPRPDLRLNESVIHLTSSTSAGSFVSPSKHLRDLDCGQSAFELAKSAAHAAAEMARRADFAGSRVFGEKTSAIKCPKRFVLKCRELHARRYACGYRRGPVAVSADRLDASSTLMAGRKRHVVIHVE